ncbi:MAG: hypothetical protein KatS3mg057_0123 [Herpetosiphonaceae bacterium]|nr:MAG: hypothetical protein KatS3mg057_0123 [Herpetosiphonaceae bacterium]
MDNRIDASAAPVTPPSPLQAKLDQTVYRILLDHTSDYIHVMQSDGTILTTNASFRHVLAPDGDPPAHFDQLVDESSDDDSQSILASALKDGIWQGAVRYRSTDDRTMVVQLTIFPIPTSNGSSPLFGAIARDLSTQLWAEQERLALQEQIIAIQQLTLQELSTPLLPIAPHVIVMPLIGAVDSTRAHQIMESLLEGVMLHRARIAILDVTGVAVIDTQVANALLRAAQAAQLLGAQIVLTGIRPDVAQTLVGLEITFATVMTLHSLQDGIQYALAHAQSNQPPRSFTNGRP